MVPQFFIQSHAALFGVGCNLSAHTEHFLSAKCFFEVRKALEQKKLNLVSLTVRQFKNHQTLFVGNAKKSIDDQDIRHKLLLPLITDDPTIDGLRRFIVACSTLTASHVENLQTRGLADIFPRLVMGVIDDVTIPMETMRAIVEILQDIYKQTDLNHALGPTLQDILRLAWKNGTMSDPEPGPPAKRARLNEPRASGENRDANCLEFGPDILDAIANEDLNLDEPPELAERNTISQFVGAKVDRIVGVFGTSPLFQALKTSRQWRWERAQDGTSLQTQGQTNCLIALVPNSDDHDFSFILKVGNQTGWAIIDYLEYEESIEPAADT